MSMDIFTFMKTADNGVIALYNFTRPILVIDVETPNKRNNRICAIGTVKLCKGEQPKIFYTLVNPECSFDKHNIIEPWELAERLNLPEDFVKKAMKYYHEQDLAG